jgi:hypothetical protein
VHVRRGRSADRVVHAGSFCRIVRMQQNPRNVTAEAGGRRRLGGEMRDQVVEFMLIGFAVTGGRDRGGVADDALGAAVIFLIAIIAARTSAASTWRYASLTSTAAARGDSGIRRLRLRRRISKT